MAKNWGKKRKEFFRGLWKPVVELGEDIYYEDTEDVDKGTHQGYKYKGGYNYDFGSPVTLLGGNKKEKETTFWEDYEKTGVWHGYSYYRSPTLDYRYVEKMANLFASQYNVTVQIGANLAIDIEKRILFYNPQSLMFGTKANLIASLLHEIGHLRYTSPRRLIKSPYLDKYNNRAFHVINVFEDFRVDKLMLDSYEGAEDCYEANKPIIRKMAEDFQTLGTKFVKMMIERIPEEIARAVVDSGLKIDSNGKITGEKDTIKKIEKKLGTSDIEKIIKKLRKAEERILDRETFFDYCSAILLTGYGERPKNMKKGLSERIDKTETSVEPVKNCVVHQDAIAVLDQKVFPVIEDLMKEMSDGFEEIEGVFEGGTDAKRIAKEAAGRTAEMFTRSNDASRTVLEMSNNPRMNQDTQARPSNTSGHSDQDIPRDWVNGEYEPLRESVQSAINELVARLTFLKRSEQVPHYQANQRRGRINTKSLYRHPARNPRLFKKKLEIPDTVSSFAFSLIIDTSGSMAGNRIVHTTRGLVILTEVFKKMKIPFEIQTFNDAFRTVKPFKDGVEKVHERKIAGLTNSADGGTNLYKLFGDRDKELIARSEKNKVAIILSDGGVGDHGYYQPLLEQWEKKNIKYLGVGVNCGDQVVKLLKGRGVSVQEAAEIPSVFATMLKDLIKPTKVV